MGSHAQLHAVRVEDGTSIGRSYSAGLSANVKKGLGAARRALTSRSWDPHSVEDTKLLLPVVLESQTAPNLQTATREQVLSYFRNTWALTDSLFSALRNDSVFYMIPDKLRRPLIFYFCHPAALYINKCHQAGLVDRVNPAFEKVFETGVDELSWDDMDVMQDEDYAWPGMQESIEFRAKVKAAVEGIIRKMPQPCDVPVTMASPYWALFLGFEHERIHLETSSVLIHQLPIDCVVAPLGWRTAPTFATTPAAAPPNALVSVPGSTVVIGKPHAFPSFGWDNEYGERTVSVPAFTASQFLVTNAEFLPFVEAGGYTQAQWWLSPTGDDEGLRWRQYRNATHPSFWVATSAPEMARYVGGKPDYPFQEDDGHARAGTGTQFRLRTMFDIIDMPWDWPVEVNYHEARAFLNWMTAQAGVAGVTYRMPTEGEYHAMRADPIAPRPGRPAVEAGIPLAAVAGGTAGDSKLGMLENGKVALPPDTTEDAVRLVIDEAGRVDVIMQPTAPGNLNLRWHSSTPVDMYQPSTTGFYDTHGNVWQWVEDHFAPLPGFEIHYLYDDFSTPCFDGWHTEIMGGSWVSTGDLASSFARYHFRRHFFQHLGFRYVRLTSPEPYPGAATVTNLWEGASAINQDITNAYCTAADKLPFAPKLVDPSTSLSYPITLANTVAKAYLLHTLGSEAALSESEATGQLAAAKVLHLGCGVGGGSFELLRSGFGQVLGLDRREVAIRHARVLQHHGQFAFERVREGVLTDTTLVAIPASVDRCRISFVQDDAACPTPDTLALGPFDVVVVDALLTRQQQPLDLMRVLPTFVRPGGLCIITSNNDWNPAITPRNSWLGGFKMNGEDMPTLRMLKYHMKKRFEFLEVCDIAKMSRSHDRRFVLDVMETSVWRMLAQ